MGLRRRQHAQDAFHFLFWHNTFDVSLLPLVWRDSLPGENPESIGKKWCVFSFYFLCRSSLWLKVWAKASRKRGCATWTGSDVFSPGQGTTGMEYGRNWRWETSLRNTRSAGQEASTPGRVVDARGDLDFLLPPL
jgi:hypothetical protein